MIRIAPTVNPHVPFLLFSWVGSRASLVSILVSVQCRTWVFSEVQNGSVERESAARERPRTPHLCLKSGRSAVRPRPCPPSTAGLTCENAPAGSRRGRCSSCLGLRQVIRAPACLAGAGRQDGPTRSPRRTPDSRLFCSMCGSGDRGRAWVGGAPTSSLPSPTHGARRLRPTGSERGRWSVGRAPSPAGGCGFTTTVLNSDLRGPRGQQGSVPTAHPPGGRAHGL